MVITVKKPLGLALGFFLLVSFVSVASAENAQASVTTQPAIIIQTSAILNASISRKNYLPVDIWFGWRVAGGTWENTPSESDYTDSSYSYYLTGLTLGTTYEFKAWISFEGLENSGSVLTFTTPEPESKGKLNVTLISLGDEFDIIPILPDLPFAPTPIASGFNLIYITDSDTGEPVDADVTLNFFTLGLWGGMELDPMLMFMMLQGGGLGGQLFGMELEVPVVDGMGVLFVPEGVEFARATVYAGEDYRAFGFFLRFGETAEATVELSVSVPSDPAAGLVGISANIDGGPAEGAGVYVDGEHQGKTDAEGNLAVALEKGSHIVRVEYQDLEHSVGVTAWEQRVTRIELQKARVGTGDTVKGTLTDEYGNPVQNVRVVLGGQSSFTGADGGFELSTGVEVGTRSVISEHRFDAATYISYTSAVANIEIMSAGSSWGVIAVILAVIALFMALALRFRKKIGKVFRGGRGGIPHPR